MALIKCGECGKKISDKADRCVNCGTPMSEISKTKINNDGELNDLKNYIKRDSKLKKIILVILALIVIGIISSKVINSIKEKDKNSKYESMWMEKSKGSFYIGDYSIKMDGKGNATLCVGNSCTYPSYKYEYPNGYIYSDDNNFVSKCYWVSIHGLRSYDVSGLSCEKSNGKKVSIPLVVDGEYVKTIQD